MRRFKQNIRFLIFACLLSGGAPVFTADDPSLSGTLIITGSDTMAALVTSWADAFIGRYPAVHIEIQALGSGSAPPALAKGTANLGAMSRPMTGAEIERFTSIRGHTPVGLPVGIDTIGLIVNRSNPLDAVNLETVDAIFSSTRSCGSAAAVDRWADLHVGKNFAPQWIEAYGRTSVSGTHGFFKRVALCGGDFSADVNALPGSAAVIDAVAQNPAAIGYAGVNFINDRVKLLAIERDGVHFSAEGDATLNRDYPLSRVLFIYTASSLGKSLSPLECAFLDFIRSDEGMQLQRKLGSIPMPKSDATTEKKFIDACG